MFPLTPTGSPSSYMICPPRPCELGALMADGVPLTRLLQATGHHPSAAAPVMVGDTEGGEAGCMRGVNSTFFVCDPINARGLERKKGQVKANWG